MEEEKIILEEANRLLVNKVEDLNRKAFYDQLTQLKSRLALDEEMEIYFNRIYTESHEPERRQEKEENGNLVFAIFDIDKFKAVNDTFGHQMGDVVLKAVAETISSCVRDTDIVARWGGEEMVVVFPETTLEGAELKANLIRQKISEIKFEEEPGLKVTISVGLAHSSDFKNKEDLFKAADKALYKSKETGRNRVAVYSKI